MFTYCNLKDATQHIFKVFWFSVHKNLSEGVREDMERYWDITEEVRYAMGNKERKGTGPWR
jgi:hypothetical protein